MWFSFWFHLFLSDNVYAILHLLSEIFLCGSLIRSARHVLYPRQPKVCDRFQGYKNDRFHGRFDVAFDRPDFDRTQQCLVQLWIFWWLNKIITMTSAMKTNACNKRNLLLARWRRWRRGVVVASLVYIEVNLRWVRCWSIVLHVWDGIVFSPFFS